MRILIVEDDDALADLLVEVMKDQRYAVDRAADGETASELVAVNEYDLVILDWSIPGPSGLDLLRAWRQDDNQTPVIMLTGHRDVDDRVDGLDTGADDYLTKPFSFEELLARVRSLLRRRERVIQTFEVADLHLDSRARRVEIGGEVVELAPKEFAVLEYLLSRVGEVVTRIDLAEHAWDDSFDAMSNVIDVTVHRLRRKIDDDRRGTLLHTVKGVGYVLKPERQRMAS